MIFTAQLMPSSHHLADKEPAAPEPLLSVRRALEDPDENPTPSRWRQLGDASQD
jgi:hypothetical protein